MKFYIKKYIKTNLKTEKVKITNSEYCCDFMDSIYGAFASFKNQFGHNTDVLNLICRSEEEYGSVYEYDYEIKFCQNCGEKIDIEIEEINENDLTEDALNAMYKKSFSHWFGTPAEGLLNNSNVVGEQMNIDHRHTLNNNYGINGFMSIPEKMRNSVWRKFLQTR